MGSNRLFSVLSAAGVVLLLVGGVVYFRSRDTVKVEILDDAEVLGEQTKIQIDVQGEVVNPGVYQLDIDARIKDAVAAAGGLSASADRIWVARYINLAQKVVDGSKIFIPREGSTLKGEKRLNINTAAVAELDSLTGVGETRAKAIVAGRPYGDIQELVARKILPQSVFDKIKEELSVF